MKYDDNHFFVFYYINNIIQNGTPALSKIAGTIIYSVSQVVNKIESDKAIFKIDILDPSSIIQLDQVIDSGILQSNSTFNYTFNFTLSNLSNYPFSNVVISDNLYNSIPITSDFSIIKNVAEGSLISNNSFNSNSDVELTQKSSLLAPLSKNKAIFTMNLSPRGFVGSLSNVAFVKAETKWGTIETESSPASFYVKDLTVSIPEGFSPNHDGVHDYFVIIRPSNITIDLKIFNRWGNFVYTNSNYKNEWDGTGTDNFLGQELLEGGYYYTVRAIDEQGKVQVFNGYVILKR
jgi:gliding motility-associated-like protein